LKGLGDSEADAPAGAGDEGDATLQSECHCIPSYVG
jgi:hypothetical protein